MLILTFLGHFAKVSFSLIPSYRPRLYTRDSLKVAGAGTTTRVSPKATGDGTTTLDSPIKTRATTTRGYLNEAGGMAWRVSPKVKAAARD